MQYAVPSGGKHKQGKKHCRASEKMWDHQYEAGARRSGWLKSEVYLLKCCSSALEYEMANMFLIRKL